MEKTPVDAAAQGRQRVAKAYDIAQALYERSDPPGTPEHTAFSLVGLAAMGHPADRMTDAMVANIAAQQAANGSWHATGIARPPGQEAICFAPPYVSARSTCIVARPRRNAGTRRKSASLARGGQVVDERRPKHAAARFTWRRLTFLSVARTVLVSFHFIRLDRAKFTIAGDGQDERSCGRSAKYAANSSVAPEPRVQRGEVLNPLSTAAALMRLKAPVSVFFSLALRPSIHPREVRDCLAIASLDVREADVLHFMAETAEREKSLECLDS
jgi:hypothetical protein